MTPSRLSTLSAEQGGEFGFGTSIGATPETPSRPILIKSAHESLSTRTQPATGPVSGSATLRSELPADDRDLKYSDALRAEDVQKLYNSKLRAEAIPELPSTLSPTTSLSPWLTILNPSNPDMSKVDDASLYSRWQHVFPRPSEMRIMKWKSLCCPASVPLTLRVFPHQGPARCRVPTETV